MSEIFISYKREDRARAAEVAQALQQCGHTVFFDLSIPVGDAWDARIEAMD